MSDEKKCGTTDCKLYNKWTGDNCGKMIEGRRVEFCKGYTEAPRPQDSSGSAEFTGCVPDKATITEMLKVIKDRQPEVHAQTMETLRLLQEAYDATENSTLHFG